MYRNKHKYKYKKINPEQKQTIMLLSNAFYYFIEWAMIVYEKDEYRLLVYYQDKLTTDKQYQSPEDAKKDFKEIYKDLKLMDTYDQEWVGPYEVEISWVNRKLRFARLRPFVKKIIRYFRSKKEYLIAKF